MNTSGEAADQIVRMSLEAGEAALKISGAGAKQFAVLLYAVLKEQKKTRGRARMETLVRSGRPLTVFSVKEGDLKKFTKEAKGYGILYCAVRGAKRRGDGMVDIMVKEEDAPRINRIVERFKFASVSEAAQVKTEIEEAREKKKPDGEKRQTEKKGKEEKERKEGQAEPEKAQPEKSREDILLEELMGQPARKEGKEQNPSSAETGKAPLSEPTSGKRSRTAGGTSELYGAAGKEKPSVREQIKEIRAEREKKEAEPKRRAAPEKSGRTGKPGQTRHKQPQAKKKRIKGKER